jgi:serine/threonine protein kinase
MAQQTASTFLEDLRACGLLTDKQQTVLDLEIERVDRKTEPATLARQLVKQGWLTQWQAEMLLNGQTGLRIQQYRMLDILGRGGMGTVFRARDTEKNRDVAIKVMAKKLAKNQTLVTRFKREIQAVMSIDSPHVVKALDAGRIGRILFFVMEVVDGRDLDSIISRGKRLPPGIACELVRQTAIGLQAAHERHMVHRDIKPGNLILTWPGASAPLVKIIDMGLVRSTRKVDDKGVTRDGQAMGTPDYMAPEQGLDASDVDIRADIYSVGCTLFRMISGTVPFRGDNALKVLLARCQGEPPQLVDRVPDVDPRINAVVLKMMAREPGDRYQTPQEVADALVEVAEVPTEDDLKSFIQAANSLASKKTARPVDARLNQFLNELAGGDAELISASSYEFGPATSETVPIITNIGTATGAKDRVKSGGRGRILVIGSCMIVFLSMLVGLKVALDPSAEPAGSRSTALNAVAAGTAQTDIPDNSVDPTEDKTNLLAPMERYSVGVGSTLSFTVRPTEFLNADDKVVYTIDESDLETARLDPSTGQFQWTPPANYSAAEHEVVFSARTPDGELIGQRVSVTISVTGGRPPIEISPIADQTVDAGSLVEFPIPLSRSPGDEAGSVRLQLETLTVENPRSLIRKRRFIWQTTAANVGIHRFWLKMIDRRDVVISEQEFKITVTSPAPRTLQLAEQTATVGQQFSLQPNVSSPRFNAADVRFTLKEGPDGLRIIPATNQIRWTPKPGDVGRHQVSVEISRKGKPKPVLAVASFLLIVEAAKSGRMAVPNEAELKQAREEVESVFSSRDITAARSLSARRELSQKLFDRATETEPSAQTWVLLTKSRDLAIRGRDFPAAVECVRELQIDFDIDGVSLLVESLKPMRTRDLAPVDRQLMSESLFAWMHSAVDSGQFEQADDLIKHLRSIATAERNAELKTLVGRVAEILDKIRPSDGPKPGPAAADLAANELKDILAKLKFAPLFKDDQNFGFLNHSTGDVADRGRSLWKIDNGRVSVQSEMTPVSTGFIDRSQQFENYVLRMDVAASSSSGKLIFGAVLESGRLDAFEIDLSANQFGILRRSGSADPIARPAATVTRSPTGWDHLEIEVRGANLAVRLNNLLVLETAIERPASGVIGLDAQLATPQSKLQVRSVRVRRL